MKIRIGLPDLFQHLDVEAQVADGQRMRVLLHAREAQPLVSPVLTEVAIHGIVHVLFRNRAHATNEDVDLDPGGAAAAERRSFRLVVVLKETLEKRRDVLTEGVGLVRRAFRPLDPSRMMSDVYSLEHFGRNVKVRR